MRIFLSLHTDGRRGMRPPRGAYAAPPSECAYPPTPARDLRAETALRVRCAERSQALSRCPGKRFPCLSALGGGVAAAVVGPAEGGNSALIAPVRSPWKKSPSNRRQGRRYGARRGVGTRNPLIGGFAGRAMRPKPHMGAAHALQFADFVQGCVQTRVGRSHRGTRDDGPLPQDLAGRVNEETA